MEPSKTKVPTQERPRAPCQITRRKGSMQHREEELLPIRHDNPSPQRFYHEAEAHQASAGLSITAVVQRREQDRQAPHGPVVSGPLVRCPRECLLASQGRRLRGGYEASQGPAESGPRAGECQDPAVLQHGSHLGCCQCIQ